MANTYSQLNIHAVYSVLGRENFLLSSFRQDLFKYTSGIIKDIGQFPLAVNGFKDHLHVFFELKPSDRISDIAKITKANSSKWINDNKLVKGKFSWQEGYGVFSYSRSQRNNVIQYIMNQEEHHKGKTFREEYLDLLKKFEIDFDSNYLFEFYD
jgi:REP element-mobilizing transposase RayT